jgi:hypothetical protein
MRLAWLLLLLPLLLLLVVLPLLLVLSSPCLLFKHSVDCRTSPEE